MVSILRGRGESGPARPTPESVPAPPDASQGAPGTTPGPTSLDPPGAPTPLLTVREAAARLAISLSATYRLIESGELEGVRIGKSWRVRASSVDVLIERGS